MNDIEFIDKLKKFVIHDNNEFYKKVLDETPISKIRDPFWIEAKKLYEKSNENEKKVILDIFNTVIIDTLSNMLGIIDGTSIISNNNEFLFLDSKSKKELNGRLQDLLLGSIEISPKKDNTF